MKSHLLVLLSVFFLCLLWGVKIQSRVYIDITEPNFRKLPVAVPDFKREGAENPELSSAMAELLRRDLDFSGAFSCLDPAGFLEDPQKMGTTAEEISFASWKRLGAEFLVRGSYLASGGQLHLELRLFDVVAGKMVLGQAYDGGIKDYRRMIHHFADMIMKYLTGTPGVFSTKIAFVNKDGGLQRLYVVDFDGSNPLLLTPEEKLVLSPSWSPDGNLIAYTAYRSEKTMGISLLSVFTGAVRTVYESSGVIAAPRFHPSQPLLAVSLSAEDNPDIYIMDASTGRIIKKAVGGWAIELPGSWSPDGKKIAYVSGETGSPQIYIVDVETGRRSRLTFYGNYNTSPAWSPDGSWIAYSGRTDGHHHIFLIRPDGTDLIQLTSGNHNDEAPVWSPDGRMIAFQSNRSGNYAIWIMLKNGQNLRRLTDIKGDQLLPAWSPRPTQP
ncbi:Tol-Pal system beta propeller repeat protein TolB [Thermodesulforhabdus norvegica]|uniref:TolB protein n=1 Tax=Thermodesulforhabdus norvegica TaxID=39841 RepID=A0A1I4TEU4_9BACT|nr:Tol-Pal system beta propeller repeat protein TolB [Thermodesulforhabdus norvegica]SFM75077.1 TolB protein [Thermodesulforhabdus norvegica]